MADINILSVISKLRPRVQHVRTVDLDNLADEIAVQSGFDRGDARDFAYEFARGLISHLTLGNSVKLGDIGSFSIDCDKNKNLRVKYRASNQVRNGLTTSFQGKFVNGENAGLDDEGFATRWLELHPEDAVIMRDGSTRTAT